ncbi:MAG: ABC transporter permease [Verrucomicrobiae bacterium]|nr:ABC transporter permease [Verrucomicrobiae bacterium]
MQDLLLKLKPFSSLLGLAFVFGLFALAPASRESFLTLANGKIILTQTVVVAIGAIGMTLIIVSKGIDLSVGSSIALSGIVAAVILRAGASPVLALLAALGTGALVGLLNGTLVASLRITPFIVTLGMLGIARGTSKWVADNQTVGIPDTWINQLMQPPAHSAAFLSGLAPGVWLTLFLTGAVFFLMKHSVFGRYIYAIGSNEQTARLCGINVPAHKIMIYGLAGLFFGLAGLLQLSRLRQGDPTIAMGLELDIIAAVIIGGASLNGGIGTVCGSVIGALMMAVLRNGSTQMEWPTYFQEIIIGFVIIIAVGLDRFRNRQA